MLSVSKVILWSATGHLKNVRWRYDCTNFSCGVLRSTLLCRTKGTPQSKAQMRKLNMCNSTREVNGTYCYKWILQQQLTLLFYWMKLWSSLNANSTMFVTFVRAEIDCKKIHEVRRRSIFPNKKSFQFSLSSERNSCRILLRPGSKFWLPTSQCDGNEFIERASKTLAEV